MPISKPQTFQNALAQFNRVADSMKLGTHIRQRLEWPERVLETSIHIRDCNGEPKVFRAWRSQYNSSLGPYKGGIRFHPHVTREEVEALSMWMTWKTALMGLPLGGGKGGIQVDPKTLTEHELEHLSRAYTRKIWKYLGPAQDIPAPDVGTNAQTMAWMMDEYEHLTGQHSPGVITGKPVEIGGSLGREQATGLGGFIVLKELMKTDKRYSKLQKITVSGKGNVGRNFIHCLRYDTDIDWQLIAVSDSSGGIYNPQGIDMEKLLDHIDKGDSYAAIASDLGKAIKNTDLATIKTDVFAPAGLEEEVTAKNASKVKADLILELANGPVTPDAEAQICKKGTLIIPDILANAGGVTVSYFEQVQNNSNYYWSLEEVNSKLEEFMTKAFHQVYKKMKGGDHGLKLMRDFAYAIAIERVVSAMELRS